MNRRGIVLIEVVVVIAVVGMLAALLVVGVMAARERSRRLTCLNNLRQIGLALQMHISEKGGLPRGNNRGSSSFQTMLLPYLDQRPTYNAINFSAGAFPRGVVDSLANQTVSTTALGVLLCPADRGVAEGSGATNYAGNRGQGVQQYGYDGAFAEAKTLLGPAAFQDGTSTTLAVAEWVLGVALSQQKVDRDPRRVTFDTPQPFAAPTELEQFAAACRDLDPAPSRVNRLQKGENWITGEFGYTLYNHTLSINERTCTNACLIQDGAWTAGSLHPGGANVLFVDGHALFLRDRIALPIWRALGSRGGGEVVGSLD